MSNLNRITLVGTVTENPETKFGMDSNMSSSRFVLSVDRPAKQDGTADVDFIPVIAWGKSADYVAEYLKQNSLVTVEGRIQTRTTENNGQRNWITEVTASMIKVLKTGAVVSAAPSTVVAEVATQPKTENPFLEDDVPF